MQELTLTAAIENIAQATEFVNALLEQHGCPMNVQFQIDIAIDELFGNIANYAYDGESGYVTVQADIIENPTRISITFIDGGTPYNPLEQPEPDITMSIEERQIGGLGIFVVKKSMDDVQYKYENGQNIMTIVKLLPA